MLSRRFTKCIWSSYGRPKTCQLIVPSSRPHCGILKWRPVPTFCLPVKQQELIACGVFGNSSVCHVIHRLVGDFAWTGCGTVSHLSEEGNNREGGPDFRFCLRSCWSKRGRARMHDDEYRRCNSMVTKEEKENKWLLVPVGWIEDPQSQ